MQKGKKKKNWISEKVLAKSIQKDTVIPINVSIQSSIFACGAFAPNSSETLHWHLSSIDFSRA